MPNNTDDTAVTILFFWSIILPYIFFKIFSYVHDDPMFPLAVIFGLHVLTLAGQNGGH